MEINTTLFRKEPRFDTRLCKVKKILELSGSDSVHLKENLLDEYKFLTRYRDLMRLDQDDIAHCLMVLGDGYEDGILIEAEGAKNYQKIYTAESGESSSYIDTGRTWGEPTATN